MITQREIESRLQADARELDRDFPRAAKLELRILARVAVTPREKHRGPTLKQELAPAVALVVAVAVAVGVSLVAHRPASAPAAHPSAPPAIQKPLHHNGQIVLGNDSGLVASDPATGQFHTILSVPTGVTVRGASYSPDGSRLAYLKGTAFDLNSIWVLNTATGATKQLTTWRLTTCACGYYNPPSWSPDGSRLAFSSADKSGGSQIYLIDADGTHKTQLTHIPAGRYAWEPHWSPDGTLIAFATYATDPTNGHTTHGTIDVIRPDGTGLAVLLADVNATFDPAWSPDGSRIAYVLDPPSSTPRSGSGTDYQLWLMNADGSHRHKVFVQPGCCITLFGGPAWSPDGTRIALVAGALWVMNADGSNPRNLGVTVAGDNPAWQPVP